MGEGQARTPRAVRGIEPGDRQDGVRHHALEREAKKSDIILYIKSAHRTRAGAPVLLIGYADIRDGLERDTVMRLAGATLDPLTGQFMINRIRTTREEFKLFRRLLAVNAWRVDPACCRVKLNGVVLRSSFLVPLYHRATLEELLSESQQLTDELERRPDLQEMLPGPGPPTS
eukprot:tig00001258_g7829.t1